METTDPQDCCRKLNNVHQSHPVFLSKLTTPAQHSDRMGTYGRDPENTVCLYTTYVLFKVVIKSTCPGAATGLKNGSSGLVIAASHHAILTYQALVSNCHGKRYIQRLLITDTDCIPTAANFWPFNTKRPLHTVWHRWTTPPRAPSPQKNPVASLRYYPASQYGLQPLR